MTQGKCVRSLRLFIATFVGATSLSMTSSPYADLLSFEDHEYEQLDREDGRALGSALNAIPYWESFNEWRCFSTRGIQFECSELDYGKSCVPTLRVSDGEQLYDFSKDPEPDMDCEGVLNEWKELLDGADAFCAYAARLQELSEDWELWITSNLKSRKGYWSQYPENREVSDLLLDVSE